MTVSADPSLAFYENGISFGFDRSFYKDAIADRNAPIDEKDLQIAIACETCLEIAKRVTTLALLVIPCVSIFGGMATLGIFGAGAASGLLATAAESEFKEVLNVYQVINAKARLFVHLDFSHKARYLAQEYLSLAMLEAAWATSLYFMQAWPNLHGLGSLVTISCVGMQYGNDLVAAMLSGVEWYFKTYKEKELLEQLNTISG